MLLDKENNNTRWKDAEHAELTSIQGFNAFRDKGHKDRSKQPAGYKKITVHMVYAVKHDGRHKARLVAGGHLTDTPIESTYSSVVSQRGVRLTIFIAELNELLTWSTDIGNAYLESYTKEKVYVIAGPEFAPFGLENHILVIDRALYGLKSSGARWWERLAEVLWDLGFTPSKAETDIWMKRVDDHYEYICVYVDDLIIASANPQQIADTLQNKHEFSLKGTGPIHYHLGCDYFKDPTGTLCYGPRRYVDKMVEDYIRMFGEKPKPASSPMERGDHPEIDISEELDLNGMKQYQSIIGSLQWAVQLGRLDITTAVMSMSSFRVAPRQGHLDRLKRIIGYLAKMRNAVIRVRTDLPDYSGLPDNQHNWDRSIYKNAKELIPDDIPTPLGKPVICTSYVDANLYHDLTTGRSVTGVLHFVNQTPIDWYSKKQATVETATYGSEFVAARTATEQIIGNRFALRYLGIKVIGPSFLFGDNKSVVTSSSIPHSQLNKRHMALSYHKLREAIASGALRFEFIDSNDNPADILSKHWGYHQVSDLIQQLLFRPPDYNDRPASKKVTFEQSGSDKIRDVHSGNESHAGVTEKLSHES
jgi:histone deacetylase 1/2